MYNRIRRAADAVALARRALAFGTLDASCLAITLGTTRGDDKVPDVTMNDERTNCARVFIGACARAYWIKSGVTLWRDASRAGIHASPAAAGVRVRSSSRPRSMHFALVVVV